jgi:hypothetical protein
MLSRHMPWRRLGGEVLLILNICTRWGWAVSITLRPRFSPGKGPPLPIEQEAGWTPEPVWTQRLEEKSSASVEDRTPVVHSVVRHYNSTMCNYKSSSRRCSQMHAVFACVNKHLKAEEFSVTYLFICGLFNKAVSSLDCIASNGRVINEWWIGKDVERSGRGLILRYYPEICLERLRKTTKTLSR